MYFIYPQEKGTGAFSTVIVCQYLRGKIGLSKEQYIANIFRSSTQLLRCCTYSFSCLSLFEMNFDILKLRWYNGLLQNGSFLGSCAKIQILLYFVQQSAGEYCPVLHGNCCLVQMMILNVIIRLTSTKMVYFASQHFGLKCWTFVCKVTQSVLYWYTPTRRAAFDAGCLKESCWNSEMPALNFDGFVIDSFLLGKLVPKTSNKHDFLRSTHHTRRFCMQAQHEYMICPYHPTANKLVIFGILKTMANPPLHFFLFPSFPQSLTLVGPREVKYGTHQVGSALLSLELKGILLNKIN